MSSLAKSMHGRCRREAVVAGLAGLLASATLGGAAPLIADAQESAGIQTQILVVLAKEDSGEIEAPLREMAALRRPPFNAFRSMKVLSKPKINLTLKKPHELALPNGRKLRLVLEQIMPDGRYRVKVSINREGQEDYLPLLQVVSAPGDPFFVAGQSHQGGTLVVGITVGQKAQGAEG